MRKYIVTSIVCGAVCGAVLRDFCWGPVVGSVFGFIVGLLLGGGFSICIILAKAEDNRKAEVIGHVICGTAAIVLMTLSYRPPAGMIFRDILADPIPASVQDIVLKTRFAGPDFSHLLKFSINPTDLKNIIERHDWELVENPEFTEHGIEAGDFGAFLPFEDQWFKVREIEEPQVYFGREPGEYEYLIYDPGAQIAYYYYLTF